MAVEVAPHSVEFAIDRGGTFTDVWAAIPGQPDIVLKLLSVDPVNYEDAPAEGIRRVLERISGQSIPRSEQIPKDLIKSIRMGTTVATNALLERKGTRHAFVVTEGFRDLLDIGYQSRPQLFALGIRKPELLYDEVVELTERVTVEGFDEDAPRSGRPEPKEMPGVLVRGSTGDMMRIIRPLNENEVREKLSAIKARGIDALAICLVHAYLYPAHEERVAELARELGFGHVSTSATAGAGMIKMISRGSSASADAYLTPEIVQYVAGFAKRFSGGHLDDITCEFMQSDGGLVSHKTFNGLRGILSGPAGGVVGHARTSYDGTTPIVGFDMGGTSTDVSRYGGSLEHVFESMTAGVSIQSPQLDINTVAAGGGSMLFWHDGLFKVGPESAGAHPGPASYRKGGPLTVTDANLFLGRLVPKIFPSIFGPDENLPLDNDIVAVKFAELASHINKDTGRSMTPHEVALGFIDIANESMSRPIRALTEARGFDTSLHNLATFGGAGGQHACEIAMKLGIHRIVIHKYSSILSAYGMALAEVVQEAQEPSSLILSDTTVPAINERFKILEAKTSSSIIEQGIKESSVVQERYLNLRYNGTDSHFMIREPEDGDWLSALEREHLRELTFVFPRTRSVHIDDIRVRGVGKGSQSSTDNESLVKDLATLDFGPVKGVDHDVAYFSSGMLDTRIYQLSHLQPGTVVAGPAIIIDSTQTIVVVPSAAAKILRSHVVIDLLNTPTVKASDDELSATVDPIRLSVFSHRFMSIAEQMGRTLQRTSLSLNIKERLDFSCAIFGPDGDLVANAPHVPVHLGSMSYAIKYQHELHKGKLRPGDVLVSNHPRAGGTHLPDITVITPVFKADGKSIAFYTASRGHHLDIGGWRGNSMPPDSTQLWQEGAAIKSFFLVRDGKFDEDGIVAILLKPGELPNCSGSRRLPENLSDLKAQIAANAKGSALIHALIDEYGISAVHFYMKKIQENAELSVRAYLKSAYRRFGNAPLKATDYLDNGSRMQVSITLNEAGFGIFDFAGTSCEMLSNMNAPPAITYSALIYTLRLLIGSDIPLNQGCLAPTKVILPEGTFLNPSEGPAVCCGNTLTSQRLVDLLLKAFHAASGSQGCMNCFGFFGDTDADVSSEAKDGKPSEKDESKGFGFNYGETICGGEGAGPTWHGASGVQIHMTNTRTTDVEIIERRYPIILRTFSIRAGSGGNGRFRGGCGVIRDFECRRPITFGIITERRVHQPYGMEGGDNGESGANYWVQQQPDGSERWVNIGSRGQVSMKAGDRCVIHTPGGGGWGTPVDDDSETDSGVCISAEVDGPWKPKVVYPRATGSVHILASAQEASN